MITAELRDVQKDEVEGLFQALIADGFTRCRCGPENDPHAVIVFYEWDDHLDMITLPRDGPAAAARMIKPEGVRVLADDPDSVILNPPLTAEWAWVGDDPISAIWAMLDLPHPDCPDAPAEQVATPAAMWLPPEQQWPMCIQVPDAGKVDARAIRLSQIRSPKIVSEQWFNDLLDEVDQESAIGFASNFTDDGVFTWGNFNPVVGRTAITEFTQDFFANVTSVRHQLDNYWLVEEQCRAMTNGKVTFTRLDGSTVTVGFVTLSHFTKDGTRMTDYQVYLDPSPLVGITPPGS
jgi:SnoaL-like protein